MVYSIRWLVRRDIMEAVVCDRSYFFRPWGKDDIIQLLRQRNCIGLVAESTEMDGDHQIDGYIIYELSKHYLSILRLACFPDKPEAATVLIKRMKEKITEQGRKFFTIEVHELAEDMIRLLQKEGLNVTGRIEDEIDGIFYIMRFDHKSKVQH